MEEHNQQGRTDRLDLLLEIAIGAKHTGICKVERGKGGVRQFGKLVFLDGQLVDATADTRDGLAAWEWLKTWSYCQYVFVAQPREEIKIPTQSTATPALANTTLSPLNLLSQMIGKVTHSLADSIAPASASSETPPPDSISKQNTERPYDPITQPPQMSPVNPLTPVTYSISSMNGSYFNGQNSMSGINNPNSMNGINDSNSMNRISGTNYPAYQWNFQPSSQPTAQQPTTSVPLRLIDGDDALRFMEKYQLSRHHRHIFFLLNGQRSAMDVVRLTRRPLYEIQQVLEDLEHYGLIKL